MTTAWTRDHLSRLSPQGSQTRQFDQRDITSDLDDLYVWDIWPVLTRGAEPVAVVNGRELWMALSVPRDVVPGLHHDGASIRLLGRTGGRWSDLGDLLGDQALGSRQWAGAAVLNAASGTVDVFYTATGSPGEAKPTFVQRIVATSGRLCRTSDSIFADWSPHVELVAPGGEYVSTLGQFEGKPGIIKAFRDPFPFQDEKGAGLLFTASLASARTPFNGAVGLARGPDHWSLRLLPPVLTADGVNNELERPHLVRHGGLVYLFFSTQAHTFHPDVSGVAGLYGFVADHVEGDWTPLNGSGLVLANPAEEPYQAYSWFVLDDLRVFSFVDFHSLRGRTPAEIESVGLASRHFGGAPAPIEQLRLDGPIAELVGRP